MKESPAGQKSGARSKARRQIRAGGDEKATGPSGERLPPASRLGAIRIEDSQKQERARRCADRQGRVADEPRVLRWQVIEHRKWAKGFGCALFGFGPMILKPLVHGTYRRSPRTETVPCEVLLGVSTRISPRGISLRRFTGRVVN